MNNDDRKDLVLIVDDVPKNIQMVASILQEEGCQLTYARDGNAAIEHVKSAGFDLILLDIMMPEMDGYEVCEKLKSYPASKDIPIIFLTAKSDAASILKGFEIGAVDYVTKPFNKSELLARVKTHLALKRAMDARDRFISEKEKLIGELEKALDEIKTLRGFIPICCSCKKIRNIDDYWEELEVYLQKHTEAKFSHGICPDCARKLYPEIYDMMEKERADKTFP